MPVSKKQQACVNRYMQAHYDRINLTVAKGGKDVLKVAAERSGISVNAYINRAISSQLERDGFGGFDAQTDAQTPGDVGAE